MPRKKRQPRLPADSAIISALGHDGILAAYKELGARITSVRSSGKAECYSLFRTDEANPSAYINTTTGKYGDSSGGDAAKEINLWQVAADLGKWAGDWQAAKRYYAELAGVQGTNGHTDAAAAPPGLRGGGKGRASKRKSNTTHSPASGGANGDAPATAEDWKTAIRFEEWSPGNERLFAHWVRVHKPGISLAAFKLTGGRFGHYKCDRLNEETKQPYEPHWKIFAVPIYGPTVVTNGPTDSAIVGYCCWSLNPTGNPLTKWNAADREATPIKMKIVGSADGVIGLHGLQMLAGSREGVSAVHKVEGPTDLLALLTAMPAALHAAQPILTNAGGARQFNPWMADLFRNLPADAQAIITHDADTPGEAGAHKACGVLVGTGAVDPANVVRTTAEQLNFTTTGKHGPDLRDYFTTHGRTWADFAAAMLWNTPWVKPEGFTLDEIATEKPTLPTTSDAVIEADDDPHRLANVFQRESILNASLRYWREEWWVWNGRHYYTIGKDELRASVTPSVKREFDRIAAIDGSESQKVSQNLVSNVIGALQGMVIVPGHIEQPAYLEPTALAEKKYRRKWVAMENGILDLETHIQNISQSLGDEGMANEDEPTPTPATNVLRPHTYDWFSKVCLPYDFDPNANSHPHLDKLLEISQENDADRIAILQEFPGYMLEPNTVHQKFLVLEGEGSNGKSAYCAMVEAMIGSANCSHVSLEDFHEQFSLIGTLGKLANIIPECGELDKVSEGKLKSYTSGDPMCFNRKNLSAIDAVPTARLILATNNRPRFSDRSNGIWRRMIIVPWRIEISDDDRIFGMDKVWFWEQSGEMPAIFNWAIRGLCRLKAREKAGSGFTVSDVSEKAKDDYRSESNPAREFIFANYSHDPTPKSYSYCDSIYEEYTKWCKASGYAPLGSRNFGKEILRAFKGKKPEVRNERETTGFRKHYYSNVTQTV